jgi:hypothetical protein
MGLASFRRETENFETLQLNFQELSGVRLASDDCAGKELQPWIAASSGRLRLRKTLTLRYSA